MPKEYLDSSSNNVLDTFKSYLKPLVGEIPKIGRLDKKIVRL